MSVTVDEPLSERPRAKPSRRLGLSGKLLLLTIPLVILAEILIYVPAIANFRMTDYSTANAPITFTGTVYSRE